MTTKTLEQVFPLNKSGNRRGMNPIQQKALAEHRHVLKPGETANPAGLSITARARMTIDKGETCPYDAQGRPWNEVLPDTLLRQALTKVEGMTHLLARIEGPVNKAGVIRDINVVFVIGKGYSQPDIIVNSPGG